MAYCRHCGAEVRSSDTFCFTCGKPLAIQATSSAPIEGPSRASVNTGATTEATVRQMNVIIDPARIIFVSILSFGLYFCYWFYLTWKHYRDYTKTENYPVWHALTLFVPVYFLFRIHAHIRSFRELMAQAGIPSSLRPGLFVILVLVSNLFSLIPLGGFFLDPLDSITGLDFIAIGIDIIMIVWVQINLNRYWRTRRDIQATNARIGVGEVIFILVGILAWIGTFLPPN